MYPTALPRHRLEITLGDYRRLLSAWLRPGRHGDAVALFERQFASYVGCRHAIAVSSGRLGMDLILQELNLPAGCEAIVPAFNLFAVIDRFRRWGIVPRFADIDRDTLNVSASGVERATGAKARVLLVTHMFGHAANMEALAGMHAFQAVLGSSQLARCEQFIARRRQVSAWLDEELARL
ncbi:MAG: DegT/DnrJ/EryC1/StrS aminotransferase family protein, partial [Planctomycetes bacterium]|nr:DegT/DnrJ/EryC1/StrS aminotransferase family protein [Planctomycetota bacterium]